MPRVYEAPAYELAAAQTSSQQYKKRADTSGFRAQFYETKLLSLLYFRAVHDDAIEEFLIATNIENIGAFDDICFKAKVKGQGKPVTVFIQTKHGENKTQALKIDLATCFNSYIRIRQNFDRHTSKESLFFKGTFNEAECMFVIFTNASVDYGEAPAGSGLPAKIHDILDTGGIVKQPNSDYNVDYLIKQFLKYQVTALTECIVRFIFDDRNYQVMLLNELVLRYHVLLAQKVLDVSDIQPLEHNDAKRYRIASFRQDFFDNNEEFIVHFRDALYSEVVKRRKIKPAETKLFLSELLGDPTDAARLSKLIGTVVTYKYGQLEFDKQSTKTFRPNMEPIDVSRSTVNRAVELAAIEMLSRLTFKVPAAFGNKDLTFRGSDAKIEKRIGHLAMKITNLLNKCEPSKIVTIDESLEDGFLQLNGGIAGAIGNIFVLDDNTKLMKITDNHETLRPLASSLYTSLKKNVHDLHEYKFSFIGDKFPKLSFGTGYEEAIVRDFLNRMLVYCNQADKKDVQEMLKTEVDDLQRNQPNYYQAKTDAILSKYYDEIQKWWMQPHQAPYLTEVINLFRRSIDNIIQDPLVSSINLTYRSSKLEQYDYTFTDDAVRSLNLPAKRPRAVIVAQNCVLTVLKVLQHLKNEDHAVLDLDYMASLPTNDLNALRAELIKTNMEKVLILVCEKIDSRNEMKILKNIAEAVKNKTSIVITNQKSLDIIHTYFPEPNTLIHDKKFSLTDVIQTSQKRIYESATVVLPGGVEIRVDHLLRGWPKAGLESAGAARAASVAAVTDKPTATGSCGFGDGDFDIDMSGLEQYQRDRLSNFHRLRTWKHLSPQVSRECLNEISFNGLHFYNVYKHAEFLTKDNVKRLLAQGYKIRQKLWTMEPGRSVVIEGMYLQRNVPLRVKKTGPPRVVVGHLEFTYNRLIGLAAAYAYEHRQSFPSIVSSAAEALGLQWDQHDDEQCKLYLSAAPGAELFVDQFSFLPLLCAMRKYQLNRLPAELVTKIGSVKNADGRTMGQVLKSNMASAERIWSMFPSAHEDLQTLIKFSRHLNSLFQE